MTTMDAEALNAALDKKFPGKDWSNKCEAFRYQATIITNGIEQMQSFPSAKAALANSKIVGHDTALALPGDVGFWDKTSYKHDMLSLGNDFFIGATGLGDTVVDFSGGIKIIHGSSYPAPFLGFARKVGNNPQALLLPRPKPALPPVISNGHTTVITHPLAGPNWNFAPPTQDIQKRIQVAMAKRGRYPGKQNGIWGNLSVSGIQQTAANVAPPAWRKQYIPGVPGYYLCCYVQDYAAKFGGFVGLKPGGGARRGILGPNAWLGFTRGLEAGLR